MLKWLKIHFFLFVSDFMCWSVLDVDECAESIGICRSVNEECVNLNGSYTCQTASTGSVSRIQCPSGFRLNPDKYDCEGKMLFRDRHWNIKLHNFIFS